MVSVIFDPYMHPSVCVHVCGLAVMSSISSGVADVMVRMCFLHKETGGCSQCDTMNGVSRAQREPYAVLLTQKPHSLTIITG